VHREKKAELEWRDWDELDRAKQLNKKLVAEAG